VGKDLHSGPQVRRQRRTSENSLVGGRARKKGDVRSEHSEVLIIVARARFWGIAADKCSP
jgi:hypothetical protein